MSHNIQPTGHNLEPLETTLEDGTPVVLYDKPGQLLDTATLPPLATSLVKLSDGCTIARNRRSAVLLETPNKVGNFSMTERTVGKPAEELPTCLEIGLPWVKDADVVVEKILVESGDAFALQPTLEGQLTPGVNMFESAKGILRDFEQDQLMHTR